MRYRRVVTNLNNKIESDELLGTTIEYQDGHVLTELWTTQRAEPNLEDRYVPSKFTLDLEPGCTRLVTCTIPPFSLIKAHELSFTNSFDDQKHGMHSTQTIDYIIVFEGEVSLILNDEKTSLKKGDIVVQRGAEHAWHNYTDKNVEIIAVMVGANKNNGFVQKNFTQMAKD